MALSKVPAKLWLPRNCSSAAKLMPLLRSIFHRAIFLKNRPAMAAKTMGYIEGPRRVASITDWPKDDISFPSSFRARTARTERVYHD